MLTAHSSELFTSPDELKGELSQFVRALPVDLRWTPVKCKRPCHGDDWQNHPYSLGELLKLPFNYTGFDGPCQQRHGAGPGWPRP